VPIINAHTNSSEQVGIAVTVQSYSEGTRFESLSRHWHVELLQIPINATATYYYYYYYLISFTLFLSLRVSVISTIIKRCTQVLRNYQTVQRIRCFHQHFVFACYALFLILISRH
jgi:hypothetical protein